MKHLVAFLQQLSFLLLRCDHEMDNARWMDWRWQTSHIRPLRQVSNNTTANTHCQAIKDNKFTIENNMTIYKVP